MRLTKITNPTTLPLSLNSLKDHLRIERDESGYDDDLKDLINAAARFIEAETHVTIIATQLRATWDCWPSDVIKLPAWPISAIDSITYTDTDGTDTTLATNLYRSSLVQCPCTVQSAINEDWPILQVDAVDAVNVNLTAGYGAAATDVPDEIKHMLKLLAGHWFKHREAVGMGKTSQIELAFDALKNIVRVNEFQEFLVQ